MPRTKTDKRSLLIQTAVKLAYRHGFRTTSLADIAEAAKVPVGNVHRLRHRILNRFFEERGAREERATECFYIPLPIRVGQCRIASFERLNFSTAFTQRLVGMMANFSNE